MSTALVARVGADISAFQREMNEVAKIAGQTGQSMVAVGQEFNQKITKPLMGVAAAATLVGGTFEKKMSTVEVTTGATAAEIENLERVARDLGATTVFGASQVAGAMDAMGLAGWNATQVYDALPGILNLAASSGLDLKESTSIVTSAISAFGLEASEAGRVVDVLATANKNSNISVDGLGEALKYVGSVAGMFGYEIEDVTLAIGLMADGGMAASQAGTSLRAAIMELSSPSEAAKEEMDKLGISMFDAEEQAKPLQTVLRDLRGSLKDMTTEQQNATLSTIFGTTALTGMSHVINASDSDFDKLIDNLEGADGNAAKFAKTMQDNLHGDMALFKSQLEEAGIVIFQVISPALRKMTERVTELVTSFNNLNPEKQKSIVQYAAMAAAIGPVLIVSGKLVGALATLKTSFAILKGAKGIGGVNAALGTKGLVGGFGKAKASAGLFSKALVGIKAAPFVATGALVVGASLGIKKSFEQDAIPSVDDLADSISSLEGASSNVADRVSTDTKQVVNSFANMHIGAMTEIKALGTSANAVTETQMEGINSQVTDMVDFNISELERRRDEALETIREQHEREGILTREEIDERVEEASIGWDRRITKQETKRDEMLEKLGDSFDDEGRVVDTHYNELLEMLGTFQEDSMELHVIDNEAREIMMDTWRGTEEEQQQLHYVRLLEMAREHHYDLIEQLEGATAREQAELESHFMAQDAMTEEHYIGINRELGRQHSDQLQEIEWFYKLAQEDMSGAYERGETLTRDYHQDLLGILRRHHEAAGTENSQAFNDDLALLEGHFGNYNDMTAEEYELFQKLINSAHEGARKDARDELAKQRTDLDKHYREGNGLTSEQMGLMSRHINREHDKQQKDLEKALSDQLGEYKDTYSDISRAIDVETGKQYNYWQYRQLLIEEGMGSLSSTWNALKFNRHKATVEIEEIPLSPLSFPGFANGTFNAPGGLTWVNERGPELINLPQGSQVIPAPLSSLMMANLGREMARTNTAATPKQLLQVDKSINPTANNKPDLQESPMSPILVMDSEVVARILNPHHENMQSRKLALAERGVLT